MNIFLEIDNLPKITKKVDNLVALSLLKKLKKLNLGLTIFPQRQFQAQRSSLEKSTKYFIEEITSILHKIF